MVSQKCLSTVYTVIELIDCITNKLDTHKIPFNIYIDLSKAFDMIIHNILLSKLRYYGIRDTALELKNYNFLIENNTVTLKGSKSTMLSVKNGFHRDPYSDHYSLYFT